MFFRELKLFSQLTPDSLDAYALIRYIASYQNKNCYLHQKITHSSQTLVLDPTCDPTCHSIVDPVMIIYIAQTYFPNSVTPDRFNVYALKCYMLHSELSEQKLSFISNYPSSRSLVLDLTCDPTCHYIMIK